MPDPAGSFRKGYFEALAIPFRICHTTAERMIFMDKYIPKGKLGKKARRKLDVERRGTWDAINPVTRKAKNEKSV